MSQAVKIGGSLWARFWAPSPYFDGADDKVNEGRQHPIPAPSVRMARLRLWTDPTTLGTLIPLSTIWQSVPFAAQPWLTQPGT